MGLVAHSQPGSGTLWHGVILSFASFLERMESQGGKGWSWSQGDLAGEREEAGEGRGPETHSCGPQQACEGVSK